MSKNGAGNYIIDIRDRRVRGGRVKLSSRTKSKPEYRRRDAAVRRLIEAGALDVIERLRARKLHVAEVQQAVEAGDMDRLHASQDDALTWGAASERALAKVKGTRSPATYKQYKIVCEMITGRFGENFPLRSLDRDTLEGWLHEPKETTGDQPWARARQQLALAVVGRVFRLAIEREADRADRENRKRRITRNPATTAELAAERTRRVEFLRPKEWRTLAGKVHGQPHAALMALGTLAGLRASEAGHLRTDIDIVLGGKHPEIHVQPREGEHAWGPKTQRSVRTVPIGDALLPVLREHENSGYAGERYFLHVAGKDAPLSRHMVQKWTRQAFESAGIRYGRKKDALTFHSLRHTFISWLVQSDVSLKKIELLAGTSVRMILATYSHLIDRDLRRAVSAVSQKAGE